ncbi:MAG: hypothetical protein AAF488_01185 [Planctomycetota bacterium]
MVDAMFAAVLFVAVAIPLTHAWIGRAERQARRHVNEVRRLELEEWWTFHRSVVEAESSASEGGRARPYRFEEEDVHVQIIREDSVEWIVISCQRDPMVRVRKVRPLAPDSP